MTTFTPSIRPAYFSEQPRMADVCSAAFWDSDLLGEHMHPYRKNYPKDHALFWLRDSQLNWFDPRHHFIVGTVPDPERPRKDLVVGVAQWVRLGAAAPRSWNPLFPVMRGVLRVWISFSSWVWPNRAADPSKTSIFQDSWPFIEHIWTGNRAECYDLHILAVHPSYQGLGVGKQLVRWGLNRAKVEGVSASVIMAPGVEKFYEKCGFHPEIVGRGGMGEGNPLANLGGGNIYFKDP